MQDNASAVGAPTRPGFTRDRFTWAAYLLLGYFAYMESLLGPLMPFLRAELNLNYAIGSLHVSAFAVGMVLIGLLGDALVRRLGSRLALWGGAAGMAVGAAGLALAGHPALTIAASGLMGTLGTLLLVTQQASLAHRHGERRAVAFTEGNILAGLCAMFAPLTVGLAVSGGISWRASLLLPLPLLAIMLLREGRRPVPEPTYQTGDRAQQQGLSPRFWAYWLVTFASVAAEWSFGFFGADYMHTIAGLPIEQAVTAMSIFFLAMFIGRIIGSGLSHRLLPEHVLTGAVAIALLGAVLFWQAPSVTLTIAGLALAGLGVGNLYPFSLAAAIGAAPEQAARASTRVTLATGTAILLAPLVLGSSADWVGIGSAFALVPTLLVVALVLTLAVQWVPRWVRASAGKHAS